MKTRLGSLPLLALSSLCLGALVAQANAQSPSYRFQLILDRADPIYDSFDIPAIDEFGRIASRARGSGRNEIVRADGTMDEVLASAGGEIFDFRFPHTLFEMSSTGTVAFDATSNTGLEQVYVADGSSLIAVATAIALPGSVSGPGTYFTSLSINGRGDVAVLARNSTGQAIYGNDGTGLRFVCQSGSPATPWQFASMSLLDNGSIVLLAQHPSFPGGSSSTNHYALALLTRFGVLNRILAQANLAIPDTEITGFWAANNQADLLYTGLSPDPLVSWNATSIVQDPLAGPIVSSRCPSAFQGFGRTSFSDSGLYVFEANVGNWAPCEQNSNTWKPSLFVGPDPIRDRLIGPGDVLFGRVVNQIQIGRDAINSVGQITMKIVFTNGDDAILRADPRRGPRRR